MRPLWTLKPFGPMLRAFGIDDALAHVNALSLSGLWTGLDASGSHPTPWLDYLAQAVNKWCASWVQGFTVVRVRRSHHVMARDTQRAQFQFMATVRSKLELFGVFSATLT